MHKYKDASGSSNIKGYEIREDSVVVEFDNGSIYFYTVESAGQKNIDQMKLLAETGEGLETYIATFSHPVPTTRIYEQQKPDIANSVAVLDSEREALTYFSRNPEHLFTLSPRKFEELIASIFFQNGFHVELTPQTRDGGIDIIAVQRSDVTGETLHLIECKRYGPQNLVGIGVVQRMLGVVEQYGATQGLIVTTSGFSRGANLVAEHAQHRLALHDYTKIINWLHRFTDFV